MKIEQRYCPSCDRDTAAIYCGPNHVLHAILTIFTCVLWAWVWLFLSVFTGQWRCQKCGAVAANSAGVGGMIAATFAAMLALGVSFLLLSCFIGIINTAVQPKPMQAGLNPAEKKAADAWDAKVEQDRKDAAAKQAQNAKPDAGAEIQQLPAQPVAVEKADVAVDERPRQPAFNPDAAGAPASVPEAWKQADKQLEAKAKTQLAAAKSMLTGNPAAGKKRLQKVVDDFPDSEAAKEAKKLLGK